MKFYLFGLKFSITKFDSWENQSIHMVIHAGVVVAVSFFDPMVGLISGLSLALIIEIWDGIKKMNEDFTPRPGVIDMREDIPLEGFNIFPDLFFRTIGAVLGFFAAKAVYLIIGWRLLL